MKVYNYEVAPEVIAACEARMKDGFFKAHDIEVAAVKAGAPVEMNTTSWHSDYVAARIADRMIQMHRKAGHLRRSNGVWIWNDHQ